MRKRYVFIGVIIVLGLVLSIAINKLSQGEALEKETLGIPVKVEEVSTGTIRDENLYVGTLKNKNEMQLTFKQPGFITDLYVEEGDRFKNGEILARLDTDELSVKNELAQQKTQSSKLNSDHLADLVEKNKMLYEAGAISEQELKNITLEYNMALNKMKEAQISIKEIDLMIRQSSIYAPYDGVVRKVQKKEEELTQPGQPVLQVSEEGDMIAEIAVIVKDLRDIKIGSKALLYLPDNEVIESEVAHIANNLNPQSKTAAIEIPVNSASYMLPNMSVKVAIIFEEKDNAILIPAKAIVNEQEKQYVYCYNDGFAQRKEVKIGIINSDKAEVLSGIEADAIIIVSNFEELTDGSKIFVFKGVEKN